MLLGTGVKRVANSTGVSLDASPESKRCESAFDRDNRVSVMSQTTLDVKRRYARVVLPKGMLVAWQCIDGRGMSRILTLGLGGLFLSTPDPAPVGTLVKLLFDTPGGEVRARAVVKNIKLGEGMAVAFIDMGYEDRARLNQLVKRLT
jgi:hypothetical protein